MNPQEDSTTDERFRNPQSPDPLANSPQGSDVNDTLGQTHSIPEDKDIEPDTSLTTYQDDLGSGEQQDRVHYEQHSDKPEDVLPGMNERAIRSELNNTAMSEQENSARPNEADSSDDDAAADDLREHIEDLDEGDKDRETDTDSWTDRAA